MKNEFRVQFSGHGEQFLRGSIRRNRLSFFHLVIFEPCQLGVEFLPQFAIALGHFLPRSRGAHRDDAEIGGGFVGLDCCRWFLRPRLQVSLHEEKRQHSQQRHDCCDGQWHLRGRLGSHWRVRDGRRGWRRLGGIDLQIAECPQNVVDRLRLLALLMNQVLDAGELIFHCGWDRGVLEEHRQNLFPSLRGKCQFLGDVFRLKRRAAGEQDEHLAALNRVDDLLAPELSPVNALLIDPDVQPLFAQFIHDREHLFLI